MYEIPSKTCCITIPKVFTNTIPQDNCMETQQNKLLAIIEQYDSINWNEDNVYGDNQSGGENRH